MPPARPSIPLRALATGFLSVGISGFGGVMPFIRRMVVEQRQWLTAAEFTDMLALCQFLPGPNVCNLAVCLGSRERGAVGAAVAVASLLLPPVAIVLLVALLFDRVGTQPVVAHALLGLAAAASGLVLATALRIARPLWGRRLGLGVAAAVFAAVALLRLPLLPTLLVMVPLSVALHARAAGPP